jgi:hypothetical protein
MDKEKHFFHPENENNVNSKKMPDKTKTLKKEIPRIES